MNTFTIKTPVQAQNINCTDSNLIVDLVDGRAISVPLEWFPRLLGSTPSQLQNWELLGDGEGLHWPELDEDLSVARLLSSKHE